MNKIKSFFLLIYLYISRLLYKPIYWNSKIIRRNKAREKAFNKVGTHKIVKGKRMLITDWIRKQAAKLPTAWYPDGLPANHFHNMKKRYRQNGLKGVMTYIVEVNKRYEKVKEPNLLKRIFKKYFK